MIRICCTKWVDKKSAKKTELTKNCITNSYPIYVKPVIYLFYFNFCPIKYKHVTV